MNEPLPSATGSPRSRYPFPELGNSWVMEGNGKGNYHALASKLQYRFQVGLNLMASYTWSKSIDLSDGARELLGEPNFPQNGYCLQCERALSIFHVGHRFVTSTLYEIPLGKSKALLNQGGLSNVLIGSWQISSIITLQSELPSTVTPVSTCLTVLMDQIVPTRPGISPALPEGKRNHVDFLTPMPLPGPQSELWGASGETR